VDVFWFELDLFLDSRSGEGVEFECVGWLFVFLDVREVVVVGVRAVWLVVLFVGGEARVVGRVVCGLVDDDWVGIGFEHVSWFGMIIGVGRKLFLVSIWI